MGEQIKEEFNYDKLGEAEKTTTNETIFCGNYSERGQAEHILN